MSGNGQPDIRSHRLDDSEIAYNFGDLHPALSRSEALIEADRCYFCFDAPCTTACPTGIDIPGFIQKIRSDNVRGSAHTILSENIMGGMCARVCPTEVLCEEACVRNTHEDKPVEMGPTEFRLLKFFLLNQEKVFSRDHIQDAVWGGNVYLEERTIDVHIRRLRKALSSIENTAIDYAKLIQTVRGAGYRFSVRPS